MDVPAAANALGTLGAICWSVQLIPQIVINYQRHDTTGLQPSMMMLWACAGIPLGVYNICEEFNVALRIQPQILTVLSLVTWIQCYHYERKWAVSRSLTVVVPTAIAMAAVEVALILGLNVLKKKHVEWPLTLMAVLSAVLLAAGVLRHYYDIWVHRAVRGISFLFVGIDAAGDVFSLASVFFQPKLDVLGIIIYGTEFVLWCGVFACGGYYNLLPWLRKRRLERQFRDTQCTRADADNQDHDGQEHGQNGIMLQENQSSTSVFRTVSGSSGVRPRTIVSQRSGGNAGHSSAQDDA